MNPSRRLKTKLFIESTLQMAFSPPVLEMRQDWVQILASPSPHFLAV